MSASVWSANRESISGQHGFNNKCRERIYTLYHSLQIILTIIKNNNIQILQNIIDGMMTRTGINCRVAGPQQTGDTCNMHNGWLHACVSCML